MASKTEGVQFESAPSQAVVPPPSESLRLTKPESSPWPRRIAENQHISAEAHERSELTDTFKKIFAEIPNPMTDVRDAIEQGLVDEKEIAELYKKMSALLAEDPANGRMLLYFPFELLPSRTWYPTSRELRDESEVFIERYRDRWHSLLAQHDIRANFLDGDIIEDSLRTEPQERVIKAAHLLPKLLERKLISVDEIHDILKSNTDPLLAKNISEAIIVSRDLNLITNEEEKLLRPFLIDIPAKEYDQETTPSISTLTGLSETILRELRVRSDTLGTEGDLPEARRAWLTKELPGTIAREYGVAINEALHSGTINLAEITAALSENSDPTFFSALLQGVENSILSDHRDHTNSEQKLTLLEDLWRKTDGAHKAALRDTLIRLHNGNCLPEHKLDMLGINAPKLSSDFSEIEPTLKDDLAIVSKLARSIEGNSELSRLIYPAVIFFGSRIKGYGSESADIDVAVFVRPNTSFSDRAQLQTLMREEFSHEKIGGKAVEFWLEEKDGELGIKDFENPDAALGDSTLSHILFNGAWCGDQAAITELHEKILTGFLESKDKKILGDDARAVWLEEMERDALQYRLMHKGYQRFNPAQGGITAPHREAIDGQSVFYDSGYRRIATELYLKKVFLPQIEA